MILRRFCNSSYLVWASYDVILCGSHRFVVVIVKVRVFTSTPPILKHLRTLDKLTYSVGTH